MLGFLPLLSCDHSSLSPSATTVNLRIEAFMGNEPLRIGARQLRSPINYTVNGRLVTLLSARMYISEVTLVKTDGTTHTFMDDAPATLPAKSDTGMPLEHIVTDKILLFRHDFQHDEHFLGRVEPGNYQGIRFKLGVAGLNNRVDAYRVSPDLHPLGGRGDRVNFWSTEKGYIFLRMDGLVDSDNDGLKESDWFVQLGTSDFLNTVELSYDFTIDPKEAVELHLAVDYARFIADLDYGDPDQLLCYTTNNLPVAQKVSDAIPHAFSFNGVRILNSNLDL